MPVYNGHGVGRKILDKNGDPIKSQNPLYVAPYDGARGAFGAFIAEIPRLTIFASFAYNLNTEQVVATSLNGGSVSHADAMAIASTGTSSDGSAEVRTIRSAPYYPGQGVTANFSAIFTAGVTGSYQLIGLIDDANGFAFGYNGSQFGVLHRRDGVDTWIPQESWNGDDRFDGLGPSKVTLDPTKGNVYGVRVQYLGFGVIEFLVENPQLGRYEVVHRFLYPNSANATRPHISNPSLPISMEAANNGNTSDVQVKTGSVGASVEGPLPQFNIRGSYAHRITGLAGTLLPVISIRCTTSFQSAANRVSALIESVAFSAGGRRDAQIYLVKNAALTGSSFADFDTDTSVIEVDTSATAISGGRNVKSWTTDSGDTVVDHINDVRIHPGETLTIAAVNTSGRGNVTPQAALNWVEEQ